MTLVVPPTQGNTAIATPDATATATVNTAAPQGVAQTPDSIQAAQTDAPAAADSIQAAQTDAPAAAESKGFRARVSAFFSGCFGL